MHDEVLTGSERPRVLITRPEAQAEGFAQLCTQIGFEVALMPCLEIVAKPLPEYALSTQLANHQTVLFTSANAVHIAHALQPLPWAGIQIHAIGAATARQLKMYEQPVEFEPRSPYNSEAYLAQTQNRPLESLLILKGRGGRDHIQKTLEARGCQIGSLDLYFRRLPELPRSLVDALLVRNPPDIISVTSNDALNNLCSIANQHLNIIRSLPLVVNSTRCAELAEQKGFTLPARVAMPAGDQGQANCLAQWLDESS